MQIWNEIEMKKHGQNVADRVSKHISKALSELKKYPDMGQWIIKLVVFNRSGNCCRKTAVIARFLILGGIFKGQHFEYSKTIKRRRSKNNKIGSGKRQLDLSHSAIRGLMHRIMDTLWGRSE